MEQSVKQSCYCDLGCVERKERTHCIHILIMKIHHIKFSNISKTLKYTSKCT